MDVTKDVHGRDGSGVNLRLPRLPPIGAMPGYAGIGTTAPNSHRPDLMPRGRGFPRPLSFLHLDRARSVERKRCSNHDTDFGFVGPGCAVDREVGAPDLVLRGVANPEGQTDFAFVE